MWSGVVMRSHRRVKFYVPITICEMRSPLDDFFSKELIWMCCCSFLVLACLSFISHHIPLYVKFNILVQFYKFNLTTNQFFLEEAKDEFEMDKIDSTLQFLPIAEWRLFWGKIVQIF